MPQPEIDCRCGAKITVNLWDAGIDISCSRCGAIVSVPSLEVLKRLAGDKHPLLSNWQKLVVAIEDREEPFDGAVCRACETAPPQYEVPIELAALKERQFAGVEDWQRLTFPLQLCAICHREFRRSFFWKRILRRILSSVGIAVASIVILITMLLTGPLGILGLPIVVFVRFVIRQRAHRKKKDWRFSPWLDRLSPVANVLTQESECKLSKKESVALK